MGVLWCYGFMYILVSELFHIFMLETVICSAWSLRFGPACAAGGLYCDDGGGDVCAKLMGEFP